MKRVVEAMDNLEVVERFLEVVRRAIITDR
jgi:hypothetical protein